MSVETKSSRTTLDRDALACARKLMLLTARTLRSMNTYPSNSPAIEEQKYLLDKEFQSFLEENHTLTVTISESRLLIGDQVVYEEETRNTSLSFLLYKDGLREISFYEGITRHDLDEFLEALAENWLAPEETDVVSSLWERDLSNIRYIAIDEIFGGDADPIDTNSDEARVAGSELTIRDNTQLSSGTITLRKEDRRELKQASSGITGTETKGMNVTLEVHDSLLLNDQDLQEIERIVDEDKKTFAPPRELADALFEILSLEENPEEYHDILNILEGYLSGLISNADFGMAYQILLALMEIQDSPSPQSSKYRVFLETVLERGRSPESIKKIRNLLRKRIAGSPDDLFNYISLLGANAIPILIDILVKIENPEIHLKAHNLLGEFARTSIDHFQEWLLDSRANLVKQIVSVFGQTGFEDAVPYLKKCLNHPDINVRKETVRTLSKIGGTSANMLLVEFLNDQNPDVRILATSAFSNPDLQIVESMCSMILQKEFTKKDMREKKAWVDFLRKTGSDTVVPVLRDLLNQGTWFRRRENNEFKAYVASALGSIATESAIELLLRGTQRKNRKVRDACEHALERARKTRIEEKRRAAQPLPDETAEET